MTSNEHVILVVDDDEDIRDVLAELLAESGYKVARAASGAQALEMLRGGLKTCAILLDLMMPVMDGWQFRAAQLVDPSLASIPVVVITASGARAGDLGDVAMLRKPLKLPDVVRAVRDHCVAS